MTAPTSASKAAPARASGAARPPHHAFRHTPVAAVVNACIGALLLAMVARLSHHYTAPLWALLGGGVLAVALVLQGALRTGPDGKHRPLSGRSLAWRASAGATAGVWLWAQVADFSVVPRTGLYGLALLTLAALVATPMVMLAKLTPWWGDAILAAIVIGCAVAGVSMMSRGHGAQVFTAAGPLTKDMIWPWLWHCILTLLILGTVFGILGTVCARHERHIEDALAAAAAREEARLGPDALRMQQLLREATNTTKHTGIRVISGPERWPNGAGETYSVDASAAGMDYGDLKGYVAGVANRLRLPRGCGVEALPGAERGTVIVQVSRKNILAETIPYPRDYQMRTVYNPVILGNAREGTPLGPVLREHTLGVFGQKGSGKTTCIHTVLAGLGQCTDVILHVIDLGGGGAAGFYNEPFYRGEADRPMIATVCTTPAEALGLVGWLRDIAVDRKQRLKHLKEAADTTLLPLSPDLPEHILLLDEGKMAMGSALGSDTAKQVRDTIEEIVDIARDSGINVVGSFLEATQRSLDTGLQANMAARISFGATQPEQIAWALGNDYQSFKPEDAPYQGAGFMLPGPEDPARVYRNFYPSPSQQKEIGRITSAWRPIPDERSLQLESARWYLGFWRRNEHLVRQNDGRVLIDLAAADLRQSGRDSDGPTGQPVEQDAQAPAKDTAPTAPATPPQPEIDYTAAGRSVQPPTGGLADAMSGLSQADFDDRFSAMVNAADVNWSNPANWPRVGPTPEEETHAHPDGPQILERMVLWHGLDGVGYSEGYDRLTGGGDWGPSVNVSDVTYGKWLKPSGRPAPWLRERSARSRYVHRDAQ